MNLSKGLWTVAALFAVYAALYWHHVITAAIPLGDLHDPGAVAVGARPHVGIAVARKRGRRPGRPPLDRETVSAAQTLVEAGLTPGQAAKQLGIGRATAYRIAKAAR